MVTNQDIQLSGYTDTIDVINSLPQNVISGGVDFGNNSSPLTAAGGITTVDLRNLGPQRTLVLVNGRRLGVGDPSTANPNPAPDIDQIPAPLIERVEVVTGGASATYGSDAIAGVVNFILRKDFQGIEIGGQYGFNQHHQHNDYAAGLVANDDPVTGYEASPLPGRARDGYQRDLSIVMGTNFAEGDGNVTGYFVFHNQDPVTGAARDFSSCQLFTNTYFGAPAPTGLQCFGSANSNLFEPQDGPNAGNDYSVVGNQFLAYPQVGSSPPSAFNFNRYEYLQRQNQRYNAGFMAHDDIASWIKPYVDFSFMQDNTTAVVAPSGLFIAGNPVTPDGNYPVNCSNPLLSDQQRALICTPAQIAGDLAAPGSAGNSANLLIGRRNIEGGGRISTFQHNNFRLVTGAQGDIIDGLTYDAYYSYYYVSAFSGNDNYLDYSAITNALQATTGPNGTPVCISGGSRCVPYNIFTTGAVTPDQLGYLYTPGTSTGNNTEQVIHADATADFEKYGIRSPFARDGFAINLGVERRTETVTFKPDGAELAGNLAGFSGASVPTDVSYHVNEAFFEGRLPIAQDLPGVHDLTIDAGYRWSNYTTAGVTNTYKFEVQYAPIQDARFRFSFDRAVRAPNLIELFNAPSIGQENEVTVDPCAPTSVGGVVTPATATFGECANTGVTAAQYGNGGTTNTITQCVSGQCSEVILGNSQLRPEVATTWSAGFTYSPAQTGFTGSLDYYHIRLVDQVGSYPFAVILNGCLEDANPLYCSQIVRSSTGSLTGATVAGGGYFLQNSFNLGVSIVSGVDIQLNYRSPLPSGWGSVSASLNGAYVDKSTSTPFPGAGSYDCSGLFGTTCGGSSINPRWRHNLRLTWNTPLSVLLSLQWRFIGPTTFDNNSSNPLLANNEIGQFDPFNSRIAGYNYLDLSAAWHATDYLEVRAGVNNMLDKDPPLVPSGDITGNNGASNSYNAYDLLGRELFVGFTAKF